MTASSARRRRAARPEEAAPGGAPAYRWVVDPLDGTVNFLFGIPQWCVSVAVQDRDGRTLAGAIFDPAREELFSATADGPASLSGRPLDGPAARELGQALVATGFYYEASVRASQARVLGRLLPAVRDIRRLGSAALDLAWTAAGRYDAYFERGVKLWDIAAGELICRRAGLALRTLPAGREGRLPAGILVARPGIVDQLAELLEDE
jgi:myo-inositol-1(or 4)-monophosphatase